MSNERKGSDETLGNTARRPEEPDGGGLSRSAATERRYSQPRRPQNLKLCGLRFGYLERVYEVEALECLRLLLRGSREAWASLRPCRRGSKASP